MSKEGLLPPYTANPTTRRPASSPGYWVLPEYLEYLGDRIIAKLEERKNVRQKVERNPSVRTTFGVVLRAGGVQK